MGNDENVEHLKIDRTPCPVCQWPMWQYAIVPVDAETERHYYVCPLCDHTETRTIPRRNTS